MSRFTVLALVAGLAAGLVLARPAAANHAWGCYHWARSSNPFTVTFGDNLSGGWSSYLSKAASDWSLTSGSCNNSLNPVRGTITAGQARSKNCRPTSGRVEVCIGSYGNNGWLGIAQIWVSGCHITQGSVKVNDYYFNQPQYNSSAWRGFVMDQETGHTLGLDHQDTDFYNADLLDPCGRGSCMDYSADPTNNTTPNQHDYDELVTIYNHSDAGAAPQFAAVPMNPGEALEDESAWGMPVRFERGRGIVYERTLGPDQKMFTWVIWAR